jgi:acylphosphatase
MKQAEFTVYGRVQGVNFRYYTQREARRLQLTGWVANRPDGSVRVVAEGPDEDLDKLLTFLHTGSPSARVKKVDEQRRPASGQFYEFSVRWL